MEFDDLYQEIILDHYKHPHNFGECEARCTAVELDNPTCGDHLKVSILVDDQGLVKEVKFSGAGCAISMASASMMTDELKGKSVGEAHRIIRDVLAVMRGEKDPSVLDEYGDLTALRGVARYPVRIKCANLAWHAAENALEKIEANDK